MRMTLAVLALALALSAGAACSGGGDEGGGGGESAATGVVDGGGGESAAEEPGTDEGAPVAASLPGLTSRVIQTASLSVSVPARRFDETVNRARTVAAGFGGFVVGSSASRGRTGRLVEGSLVLRVPARSYAAAMEALGELGRIESREESGQDVTREFVDLEARARHLEAVEAQLLTLLERADDVPAALAVQAKLNEVQLKLEQARGRLGYLEDQVAFATISLAVHERVAPAGSPDEGFGVVEAWGKAADGFLAVVGWIFVVAATASPLLVLAALGLVLWRLLRRRRLRPVQA